MFKFCWILNIWLQFSLAYALYGDWPHSPYFRNMENQLINPIPKVYIGSMDDEIVILSTKEQSTRHENNYWSNMNFAKNEVIKALTSGSCEMSWGERILQLREPSSIPAIPNNIFKYITVRGFSMKNLGVQNVSKEDFMHAYFLESLDLSNNSLVTVPSFLFSYTPSISLIDLSNNQIEHIAENAFQKDPSIKPFESFPYYCREKHSNILKKGDLAHLPIETIVLDNNRLNFVDANWFASLEKLLLVSLAFNKIQEIDPATVFANNIKLRNLDLRNNQIKDITKIKFQNSIENIKISNNPSETSSELYASTLQTFMWNVRHSESSLTISPTAYILDAGNNSISSVIPESKTGPNRLMLLKLDSNKLTSISNISAFGFLEVLILYKNLLTSFETDVFEQLPLLRQLDLSYNKLKHFDLTIAMPNLNDLNLAGNGLTTLGTNIKSMAPQLVTIGLKDNDWNCEHLTTLMLLIHSDGITPISNGTTEIPEEFKQIKYDGNVKGVNCFNGADSSSNEKESLANEVFKRDMQQLLDDKLKSLQQRLIEMIQKIEKH